MNCSWKSVDRMKLRLESNHPDLSPFEVPDAMRLCMQDDDIVIEFEYFDTENKNRIKTDFLYQLWVGDHSFRLFKVVIPKNAIEWPEESAESAILLAEQVLAVLYKGLATLRDKIQKERTSPLPKLAALTRNSDVATALIRSELSNTCLGF